ncbi:MAG: hypothetical protein DCF15_22990 [Phormidesmis priestleyi]|uniref:DUF565 domain-containing protein n=1 Tax=Phormidesmis priestleyi TaxID=268141 RepID=A0A2W4YGT7_9CYAN|nr:MAG: hypothetical protein DCF15_22990 [Phormidesmis priestleyi]
MQRTRLNTLFNQIVLRFRQWAFNPWRRLSVILISLLFGNFFAVAISATAGQTATLDVTVSAILVLGMEVISWLYYRFTPRRQQAALANQRLVPLIGLDGVVPAGTDVGSGLGGSNLGPVRSRSTFIESLNAFKLGAVYGFFVEAFKLGS